MLVWGEAGKNERELPHLCYLILAAQVSILIPLVQMRKLSPSKFQQPVSGHPLQELRKGGSCESYVVLWLGREKKPKNKQKKEVFSI